MKAILFLTSVLFLAAPALASENIPPPPQSAPFVIQGATLHTVSGDRIEDGRMRVENGRIAAIGDRDEVPVTADTRVVDLSGKHVYPALIAANTVLGLVEINAVRASRDYAEVGPVSPEVMANESVDPDSELFPVTRANGVLAALTIPQPATRDEDVTGLVTGSSAVLRLDGWTWEDMTVKAPVGVHVFWPDVSAVPPDDAAAQARLEERLQALETAFEQAHAYYTAHEAGELGKTDLRWEAMLGLFSGELPTFVHARHIRQLRPAMELARKHGLRLVIVGGQDAWRVAEELRALDAAVIVSPVHTLPLRRWEPYDTPFATPGRLAAAGVRFAIAGDGTPFGTPHTRNLPYEAATAAAYGLDRADALKAVTLYPAEILGVDDRLGSLETGKEATFFVTDGDPLEIRTRVERAWVLGREIDLGSHHTGLYDKYREKYRQLGLDQFQ